MITYVIIYNIRNNKNYSIDMSIKYNTIISIAYLQLYQLLVRQKKKRKEDINNYSIYIAIQRIYHRLFGSKQRKRKENTIQNNSSNKNNQLAFRR